MTPKKIKLEKKGRSPVVSRLLNIPEPLFERLVNEAGLKKGELTPFIIKAIEEKLDRDYKPSSAE